VVYSIPLRGLKIKGYTSRMLYVKALGRVCSMVMVLCIGGCMVVLGVSY